MPKCPFPIRISFFSYFVNESRILFCNPVKFSIRLLRFSSSLSVYPKQSMETEQHAENPLEAPISVKMFKSAPKMGSYKLGDSTLSSMIENYANSGLCGIGSMDAALRLYHEMLYQEEPSRAVDLLNCMLDRGCDPDVITCNTFLKTLSEKSDSCEQGRSFLEELVVRLLKRQGACKIVEVMLSKYLTPKASTWAMIVPEICKPKKINATIDKCWRNMCT